MLASTWRSSDNRCNTSPDAPRSRRAPRSSITCTVNGAPAATQRRPHTVAHRAPDDHAPPSTTMRHATPRARRRPARTSAGGRFHSNSCSEPPHRRAYAGNCDGAQYSSMSCAVTRDGSPYTRRCARDHAQRSTRCGISTPHRSGARSSRARRNARHYAEARPGSRARAGATRFAFAAQLQRDRSAHRLRHDVHASSRSRVEHFAHDAASSARA